MKNPLEKNNTALTSAIKRKQAGATLIEVALAVVLISGVAMFAVSSYNSSESIAASYEESVRLNQLSTSIKGTFRSQGTYKGLTNKIMLNSSGIPDSMKVDGTDYLKSSWVSNGITLAAASDVYANDSFTITYNNVPTEACFDFVSATSGYFRKVTVGSTVIRDVSVTASTSNAGDQGQTSNACGASDQLKVVFQQ